MRVGIYSNHNLSDSSVYGKLIEVLNQHNIDSIVFSECEEINGIDFLFILGGDGTILKAATVAGSKGIPVIGINYGTLGFLTEFESGNFNAAVALIQGDYELESRNVLRVTVGDQTFYALNEVVFQRIYSLKADNQVVKISAHIDGKLVDSYTADGLIVCTPTGSTAYALSAGGSILTPDISVFMITPICAHSLHSRPIVYSDRSTLKIDLSDENNDLMMFCDGNLSTYVNRNSEITIKKAEFDVKFVRNNQDNFFNKLIIKLSKWSE